MGRFLELNFENGAFPFQMVLDSLSSVEVNFIYDLLNITLHYSILHYNTLHELQNEQVTPAPTLTMERPYEKLHV
jgi:hypothetical protein